jgi:hypothetical protein
MFEERMYITRKVSGLKKDEAHKNLGYALEHTEALRGLYISSDYVGCGRHGLLIYLVRRDNENLGRENLLGYHLGKQSLVGRREGDGKITLRFVL